MTVWDSQFLSLDDIIIVHGMALELLQNKRGKWNPSIHSKMFKWQCLSLDGTIRALMTIAQRLQIENKKN